VIVALVEQDIFLPCDDWPVYNIRQLLSAIDHADRWTILNLDSWRI
jgi:hypothetical protein